MPYYGILEKISLTDKLNLIKNLSSHNIDDETEYLIYLVEQDIDDHTHSKI